MVYPSCVFADFGKAVTKMVFGSGVKLEFRDFVQGTWGNFDTPAGRVSYLMTKARLGEDSSDPERQLTKSLAPVREVMEAGSLDFNQLLQRDLDDHRVAIKLIPYLLEKKPTGPAFFPPIVAVLLPFRNKKPTEFPSLSDVAVFDDVDGSRWAEERAGGAFKVQRLLDQSDELHAAAVGKLWWNGAEARMVVLDGQHRAMALLAIERTMANSWADSSGARYRSFYEEQVHKEMKKSGKSPLDLSKIEVPVTVCWFPDEAGPASRPHEAARKLFVDVNKEARPPSESRIILLSDAELVNILSRRMLSELRSSESGELLPLFSVEYDNPVVNSSRPARWSVVTNINLLKEAVEWCIFGPRELLRNVKSRKARGRPNKPERDACMREQLNMSQLFPDSFDDGAYIYKRDNIGNEEFPLGKVEVISDRFAETWGNAILVLLSNVRPYAAHAKALRKLKEDWHLDETPLTLAHDALFGGVGVYWTLKDSYEHYQSEKPDQKSDVVRAWEALQKREDIFESYRSNEYLGSSTAQSMKLSKAAFSVFNTQACQLGLAITLATMWELRRDSGVAELDELPSLADDLVEAFNNYFEQGHGKASDHRLCFNKTEVVAPWNQIQNMDTPQAVYFRSFWLEILRTEPARDQIEKWIPDWSKFEAQCDLAREFYLDLCESQQLKALATSNPGSPESEIKPVAVETATKALGRALEKWFDISKVDYGHWIEKRRNGIDGMVGAEIPDEETQADCDGDSGEAMSVEELISDSD